MSLTNFVRDFHTRPDGKRLYIVNRKGQATNDYLNLVIFAVFLRPRWWGGGDDLFFNPNVKTDMEFIDSHTTNLLTFEVLYKLALEEGFSKPHMPSLLATCKRVASEHRKEFDAAYELYQEQKREREWAKYLTRLAFEAAPRTGALH